MTKILPLSDIIILRQIFKNLNLKTVFTNGCFDILHIGHTRYLQQAKDLGNCLIVGINSDRAVRELKGNTRPVTPEAERAEIIAALECVNLVFIYDDISPYEAIKAIVPDFLVKGADWSIDQIIGRDIVEAAGGEVATIPFVEGHSSSLLIKKVMYPLITLDARLALNLNGSCSGCAGITALQARNMNWPDHCLNCGRRYE
jgi:rfaE bifunctional protein nucleotidyltransferase chain/domain